MTDKVNRSTRDPKYVPRCKCCGWRPRKLGNAADAARYYHDYCSDCLAAFASYARRELPPPIRFDSQPPSGKA